MSETHSSKKPRSSIPFLPDPSKWIQTDPSSVKKPLNRPLVGFKNTFATPPTTVKRVPTHGLARAQARDDTPTASGSGYGSGRQGLLNAFMTPPTTSTTNRSSNANLSHAGPSTSKSRGSPIKKSAGKSKLAVHADDDSGTETKTRPMTRPLQSHKSAPVTSSSSGMSDALDQEAEPTPIRRRKKQRRTLTSSPSPPLFDLDTTEHIAHETPIASHVSSDRPITPVPDYVLDIHRRLCGRDTERMNRVKSPWRTTPKSTSPNKNQPTPVPAPRSKMTRMEEYKRHEVDVRAHDQALVKRRKKQDTREQENKVQLVKNSSQVENNESTPKKRKRDKVATQILSPRPTNTPSKRSHQVSRVKSPIRRRDHVSGHGKVERERPVPDFGMEEEVSVGSGPLAVYQAFRAPSPRIRTPRKLKRIPTGTSPRSAIPLASPSPSPSPSPTPIKHHNTTPPKNTTPTKRESPSGSSMIMTSPDLGDFAVPPQPVFTRSPSKTQDFRPVSMDAETLMTWSLGPQNRPQRTTPGSQRPDPQPIQGGHGHESQKGDSGETQTQSLAPSATSQSFPNLLLSPTRPRPTAEPSRTGGLSAWPTTAARPSVVFPETMRRSMILEPKTDDMSRKLPSLARFPTNLGVAETLHPGSPSASTSKNKSPTKPPSRVRTSMSGWPSTGFELDLGHDNPSYPSHHDTSPSKSNTPKLKRKLDDRDSLPRSGEKQPKLASFGFFSDKPPKPVRGFEQDWDQEEDLALEDEDEDEEGQRQMGVGRPVRQGEEKMGGVPEAPPHPDLRPAGLRELRRRQEEQERLLAESRSSRGGARRDEDGDGEMEEPLFPEASTSSQPGISTDDQSSLTTDDDLGMNGSVVAWYEGLEDRRSSEFGSIPEM